MIDLINAYIIRQQDKDLREAYKAIDTISNKLAVARISLVALSLLGLFLILAAFI
jgi:hypothetical protein